MSISGELESTLLNKFCQAQNLRVAICRDDIQDSLRTMRQAFTAIFDDETRGTLFNDMLAFNLESEYTYKNHTEYSALPPHLQAIARSERLQLPSIKVLFQSSISRFGVSFSTRTTASGDSMVIIGTVEKWSAATITDIFVTSPRPGKPGELYVVVEIYCPLSHKQAQHDKFLRYPLAGRLFLNRISETLIVKADRILCHYAATPMSVDQIGSECIHVLPLL